MFNKALLLALPLTALAAGPSLAASMSATTSTDLNMRMGPGPQYKVVTVMPASADVSVDGCAVGGDWCEVTYGGHTGWASAAYLEANDMMLNSQADSLAVVQYESPNDEAALIGTGLGAVVGALIAGPAGAVVGGFLTGAAAGEAVSDQTVMYVREHPVNPVLLDGAVVVGAQVPADVEVYAVPDTEQYAYLNVNGDPVVVDAQSRTILHVVR